MNLLLQKYKAANHDTIILAGAEYGSGSSRDWAAKGPMLLVRIWYMAALQSFGIVLSCFLFFLFPSNHYSV